jgi:hypothetical protein
MAALQGLKGLYSDPMDTTDTMDEGVLEAKANALDPDHGDYGVQNIGYSGTVPTESPFAGMQVYDGYSASDAMVYGSYNFNEPGGEIDQTPPTHSSPYPRGIIQYAIDNPNALASAGVQINELHAGDMGGPKLYNAFSPVGREEITHYTTDDYVAPNESYLSSDIPGQIRGSGNQAATGYGAGNADPDQGYGVVNTMQEFNAGHSIRRVQHDTAHFDFTNTHGEQDVPFPARHPVQQMPLDGPDSPYFEQGSIDGANIVWEGRIGDPTAYQQAVEPTVLAAGTGYPAQDVWAY